jgi:2-phospho-L-lactate guanylyltransferase
VPEQAWTVVIPVKGTPDAKSRLDASPELALAIALDSVAAAIDAVRSSGGSVLVVTPPASGAVFESLGARVVMDPGGGLRGAVRAGIAAAAAAAGGCAVAVLLGDVPALTPSELAAALTEAERHPRAFVADADSVGTVLITALRAGDHAPEFGGASRAAHLAAGYMELDIDVASGLRRDVDVRDQLDALAGRLGPRTEVVHRL